MVSEIVLPPLGQTSDEMSIVEWYKKVGDRVEIAEPLLCVETDKAQVDVESAEEGVLLQIVAESGVPLKSGTVLAYVGEPDETLPASGERPTSPAKVPVEEQASRASDAARPPEPSAPKAVSGGRTAQASPVVRKLAMDLGVDLAALTGSGPNGLILRNDVETAAAVLASAPTSAEAGSTGHGSTEVTPIRRAIARRLTLSAQSVPQFSLDAHLDARAARAIVNGDLPGLTYTHLVLRSVARALREHPAMLRIWSDEGPSYTVIDSPHVGLAVASDEALYVITILEPDRGSLRELVSTTAAAVERARSRRLSPADQEPASFTVSTLGGFGVESFRAIVDPDQTAILAVGAAQENVVGDNGAIRLIPQIAVSLSCDHRAVDGAQAARFLRTFKEVFETDPAGAVA